MWCEPFIFQKWCSSALHDGTSQNRQKPPRFSHDLQRMTKSASGGGNRSSGRHPDLPVRSISPKPTPKSPQIFWTLTKTWSLCWRRWVWSWEPPCACGAGRGADRERGTHASAHAPVSARWFPVRGPTRIIALRTEIGCACWRGGGRGCIFWGGGLAKHMLVCLCSLCCVSRDVTPTASTGPGWYCMCYGVLQHQVPLSWLFWVIPPYVSPNAASIIL